MPDAGYTIEAATGLLRPARHVVSPNRDARPGGGAVELIVIHSISLPPGSFGGAAIDRLFTNRLDPAAHPYFARVHDLRVSAHLLIRRDASVTQYVPLHERAWHAGESYYFGRAACNDFSIGIELEGEDDTPFEPLQYTHLAQLVAALITALPGLSARRIVGHCDIAPERKTDPGPSFDWKRFYSLLGSS